MRLITLGRLSLEVPLGGNDESLNKRRRKLALLAVLAMSRRPMSRDALIAMFWGDQDEMRARHSLSDALSNIRKVLGRDSITTHAADVELADGSGLEVDAIEFDEAVRDRDYERAASIYGGPFLDGIYVAGSSSFEQWSQRERARLEVQFLQVAERQCMTLMRGRRFDDCVGLARRWLDSSPLSANAALFLMNALKAPGTRDADQRALAEYDRLSQRLARDFDLAPDKSVAALAKDIADRLAASGAAAAAAVAPAVVATAVPPPAAPELTRFTPPSEAPKEKELAKKESGGPPPKNEGSLADAPPSNRSTAGGSTLPPDLALPTTTAEFRAMRERLRASGALRPDSEQGSQNPQSLLPLPAPAPPPPPAARSGPLPLLSRPVRVVAADPLLTSPAKSRTGRQTGHRGWWLGVAAAAVVLAAGAVLARQNRSTSAPTGKPVIAIASVQYNLRGDTTRAWMAEGLAQMISAKLEHTPEVEMIPPERVRQLKARAQVDDRDQIPIDELFDIGRRLGATWVVGGQITAAGDSALTFGLTIYDVAKRTQVRTDFVQGPNMLSLADAAAAKLLSAAGAAGSGPRLADVETSNVEAYDHFARALRSWNAGQGTETARELDLAIALDSGFMSALKMRMDIASGAGDSVTVNRLRPAFARNSGRATEWDRRTRQLDDAMYGGDHQRAEELGRQLIARFPRDPRSYARAATVYGYHGRWDEAEKVIEQELALDSLATEAGSGVCAPCNAYPQLADSRWTRGDLAGAVRAAQRWVMLQPEIPAAWGLYGRMLSYAGRYDAALEQMRRALALSGGDLAFQDNIARTYLMMRRYESADSVIRVMLSSPNRNAQASAMDARVMMLREMGRFRASNQAIEAMRARFPDDAAVLDLVRGNSLGRLGEYVAAAQLFESKVVHARTLDQQVDPRSYSWHHALLADAIAGSGDTVRIKAIADSIERVSGRSYYGRDWRLHHHLLGLVAMQGKRYAEAEREFAQAQFGQSGWTRTNTELAKARLALGRPLEAIEALRPSYATPVDAMARYEPRTMVDFWMAKAFAQAGQRDSAQVYAEYVRRAWKDAEPEVKRLEGELP